MASAAWEGRRAQLQTSSPSFTYNVLTLAYKAHMESLLQACEDNLVLSTEGSPAFSANIIIWNYGASGIIEVKLDFIITITQILPLLRLDACP